MFFKYFSQGILLVLGFAFVLAVFLWGMQWFSSSLENFFQLRQVRGQEKSLGSISGPAQAGLLQQAGWQEPAPNQGAEKIDIDAKSAESALIPNYSKNFPKIIFEKNAEEKVPIASLTKLVTALIVLDNFNLSEKIEISKFAERQDERGLLKAGESFLAKDLLRAMLVESSNSAAYAFSEALGYDKFIKLMNLKSEEIGLKNTYFSSPTGLAANYSTAGDMVGLAEYLLNQSSPIMQATSTPEFDLYDSKGVFHHKVYNSNDLLKDQDIKDRIVAGKTGTTEDAGECLLLILRAPGDKGYFINVVLNAKDRFLEMKKIIDWADKAYPKL